MAKKKKKKQPDHLCVTGEYYGVLSRNSSYREDAWNRMKGTSLYNKYSQTLDTIKKRDASQGRPDGRFRNGRLIQGKTQSQRARTYAIAYFNSNLKMKNFKVGAIPYRNQAHHIVVCEIFYDKKWDVDHLDVVLQCDYNINNEENIIYLPQCYGQNYIRNYHDLPDHSSGHGRYNERIITECDKIYDMVDKVLSEKDCDKAKEIRDQIYKKFKQIEETNFDLLKGLGASSMK